MKFPSVVEPGRLEAAKTLKVEQVSPLTYTVSGGSKPRTVTLDERKTLPCSCPDAIYSSHHDRACKHVLAVVLYRNKQDALAKGNVA